MWALTPFEEEFIKSFVLNSLLTNLEIKSNENYADDYVKQVAMMTTSTVVNNGSADISEEISNQITMTESHEISLIDSAIHTQGWHINAGVKVSSSYNILFAKGEVEVSLEGGYNTDNTEEQSRTDSLIISKEVTYSITKTVIVPSHQSVRISSYVNWLKDLQLPYTADLIVTLKSNKSNCKEYLPAENIIYILEMIDITQTPSNVTQNSVIVPVYGVYKASLGLDTVFTVSPINEDNTSKRHKEIIIYSNFNNCENCFRFTQSDDLMDKIVKKN